MDISGSAVDIHMRTDANNLVTTASTTHLPEQKETIHMINQLRQESCSGSIDDLAHVISEDCMADCLTKASAKATALLKAVNTGVLPNVDKHPSFRELMQYKHKAYSTSLRKAEEEEMDSEVPSSLIAWLVRNISNASDVLTFMDIPVRARASSRWSNQVLQVLSSVVSKNVFNAF